MGLLAFKNAISSDPLGAFSSWNHSLHFCKWKGVTCGRHHQRVTVLDLSGQKLVGSISPYISNLTFLREISLQDNSFNGQISQEIGRLFRLRLLSMSDNSFGGEIPANLSRCMKLQAIGLGNNNLTGKIPFELGTLKNLKELDLGPNFLIGGIPPSLGNLSSLTDLLLYSNPLEGSIPGELAQIQSLVSIALSDNKLSGTIPSSLYNISSIERIAMAKNQLYGSLPFDIGISLPKLQFLLLGANQFTGHFPISLSNASWLQCLGLDDNHFSGPVPEDLGGLQDLTTINLWGNQFGTGKADDLSFITSLTNCSNLERVDLSMNHFGGILPSSIANLSTHLTWLQLGASQIVGSIPSHIGNLVNLQYLGVYNSLITGTIPTSIGKLRSLQRMIMEGNMLSGQIPSFIGNITQLNLLALAENNLTGSIPSALGNCKKLEKLNLSKNNLRGSIPRQVIGLSSLTIALDLSHNSLTGSLGLDVGNLIHLAILDVSSNKLSGEIPSTLGKCESLLELYMDVNSFQRTIPSSLSGLKAIQSLGLSYNNFSGRIPKFLEELQLLTYLNLSFNNLQGEVPKQGVFKNKSAISVIGNDNLCGGIPELMLVPCPILDNAKKRKSLVSKVIVPVASAALCLIFFFCASAALYWLRKSRRKPSPTTSIEGQHLNVSYMELFKATSGFISENLIGVGSYGTVYKGILGGEENIVAVKVLNLQLRGASKSFMAECRALRNIRHRNLVKIITCCSSMDFGGNDFKALVFEYMPNGSLEKWLHPKLDKQYQLRILNFNERLNIAIDVASVLDYLHHHCHTPIAHCDLKPSNILLDEHMNAQVCDFGLAQLYSRITSKSSEEQSSTIGLKGTIGYIAPEYGRGGHVSTSGDVYSYGILLLELFTGKCPTDDVFRDGLSLHKFAEMAFPDRTMEILDPLLQLEVEEERGANDGRSHKDKMQRLRACLVSLVRIGIACSKELLRERMQMGDVSKEMYAIRERFRAVGIHGEEQNRALLNGKGPSYLSNY
ncbi:putative receptor-like protein kinase At3g47110 [Tasmannia lanceolata]|uniref:putative receptor-like protein kinase At3g47110 n=1 Tax=Tasmannia lanceolata TaxID=3420 RepID=UPI004063840F